MRHEQPQVPFFFWVFVIAVLAFAAHLILSAPIPKAKDLPRTIPEKMVGKFDLQWGFSKFPCEIGKNGEWSCQSLITKWSGAISVEKGGIVVLGEATVNPTTGELGAESIYEMSIDGDLSGFVQSIDGKPITPFRVRFTPKGPDL